MEFLNQTFSEMQVYSWSDVGYYWVFIGTMGLLLIEMLRLVVKKSMTWKVLGDSIANFITYGALILIYYIALASTFITIYYGVWYYFRIFTIPTNIWTVVICIVLADFAYYCEHRFTHRTGIGWATHSVHHSSPFFNISVAYRFGPLDGLIPIFFHLPLVVLGFHPALVIVAEAFVQLYQTPIHTQLCPKLPQPIEFLFNTPSHHRVHHGRNRQYIDKNYGGIFIIWDRMLGTFEEEKEEVDFGITTQIESVNPLKVFFHGLTRLWRRLAVAGSFKNVMGVLFRPPDWSPSESKQLPSGS